MLQFEQKSFLFLCILSILLFCPYVIVDNVRNSKCTKKGKVKDMIKSVLVFKNNKGVNVRYENGKNRDFAMSNMPKTVMNFILEEVTIAHENEISILYTK